MFQKLLVTGDGHGGKKRGSCDDYATSPRGITGLFIAGLWDGNPREVLDLFMKSISYLCRAPRSGDDSGLGNGELSLFIGLTN
nr:hypothetical protein [uncultured Massilia sp.]